MIDPEVAAAIAALPKNSKGTLLDYSDIPALREQLRAAAAAAETPPQDPRVAVETLLLDRVDGSQLAVVLYRPVDGPETQPAILWFHGGGQVLGGEPHHDAEYLTSLALACECVVAAVDYRVAPETPAPGGAEDGYLAYTHLCKHAADHDLDPTRIGLAGASGGGAPATVTALMVRDREAPVPRVLSLLYPMLDDRNETPSSHEVTDIGVFDRQENLYAWAAVLGDRAGAPDLHPYCAPGRATDLSGFPRTFLAVGQYDVFRDENIDFARRLIAAGVSVDLHVYGGAVHAWDRFAPETALARTFAQTWHNSVRHSLHA
ncbi:alpha/beta hydrolase [Amycolatopsis jiangsuensis]|uniref:Acetyl esterase/lipase n=1 Tax=Amycolatopsis jiangsuensis TaxID=1181879 RepID=A0A840IXY7_9PSEU|nr:alpha/beta hydrolase [Amycolatopsis jiangsuensis]MBB4686573.1 acetyl esterase/lipase [Amycolatopsis jiangsuensis]